jgi:hypothetical protein
VTDPREARIAALEAENAALRANIETYRKALARAVGPCSNGGLRVGDRVRIPLEGGEWRTEPSRIYPRRGADYVVQRIDEDGDVWFLCEGALFYGDLNHEDRPLERVDAEET